MAYLSPNAGTADQAAPLLRELLGEMSDQTRDFERMRVDAVTRELGPDVVGWCVDRAEAFRRQTERLERGLSDPAYREGAEFANALRWYQSLAYALDIDLTWSPLEGATVARVGKMRRLALRLIRMQEGDAAVAP